MYALVRYTLKSELIFTCVQAFVRTCMPISLRLKKKKGDQLKTRLCGSKFDVPNSDIFHRLFNLS